jgi:hypothetical protein
VGNTLLLVWLSNIWMKVKKIENTICSSPPLLRSLLSKATSLIRSDFRCSKLLNCLLQERSPLLIMLFFHHRLIFSEIIMNKMKEVTYRFSFSCPWVTIFLHSRELNFRFNSREWRNIITHMGNWGRICFSHYLTRTLFQNTSKLPIWQHAGKGTRHFNPLEDYRFFHHWFSGVKTP